jgi:hypothetical protein
LKGVARRRCKDKKKLRLFAFAHNSLLVDTEEWTTNDNDHLLRALPTFSTELRMAMLNFFGAKNMSKAASVTRHLCFVHYRAGDFFDASSYISIGSLIQAADSLPKKPKKFVWMDGGRNYTARDHLNNENIQLSIRLKEEFISAMRVRGNVVIDGTQSFPKFSGNDIDNDFLLGSSAKYLITGLGSFAITMAVAQQNHVRTPAVIFNNPIVCPLVAVTPRVVLERESNKNWETYPVHVNVMNEKSKLVRVPKSS